METYKQLRERDGIEVTTGKCNDCGEMAHRHSANPIAPPAESVDHERRLTRAHSVLPDGDPLERALVRERDSGKRLLSGLGPAAMASPLTTPRTRQVDVDVWEAGIRRLLHRQSDLLAIFNYDPLESPINRMVRSTTLIVSGGELGQRLRRRLVQLDKVIEGL